MIELWNDDGKKISTLYYNGEAVLVSTLIEKMGARLDRPCGGSGKCGKCRVRVQGEQSALTRDEQKHLSADEIAQGIRLACKAKITGENAKIFLPGSGEIYAEASQRPGTSQWDAGLTGLGLAVDIGTTTIAACLWDMERGQMLGTQTAKNPQSAFGADVISRLAFSMEGHADALQNAIVQSLNALTARLVQDAGVRTEDIAQAVVTGNTAMLYLLRKYEVSDLARAPFAAKHLFGERVSAQEMGLALADACTVYLPPCISAYVGADISCGVLACAMDEGEKPTTLLDIGTNGEMVLIDEGKMFCCATAAGPAFEGVGIQCGSGAVRGAIDRVRLEDGALRAHVLGDGCATGICGSGLIDAAACMLQAGLLDEVGLLDTDDGRVMIQDDVYLSQRDIRALQLAKSAIRAGFETMLEQAGMTAQSVRRVYLAGGFGTKLPVASAGAIGLIAPKLLEKTVPMGNTALAGASMLLGSRSLREKLQALCRTAQVIALAEDPIFCEKFMQYMSFEEEEA